MQPHRQQPTRLPHPWDSLGKNTGVGCHFLLQCMKVESESEVANSCLSLTQLFNFLYSFYLSALSLVAQSYLTLCNPMDCSTPGLSVHHQLLEFTQTHVHRVRDAIQPSHPLSSPALNLSQHQGAKVLEFQLQHQSFE